MSEREDQFECCTRQRKHPGIPFHFVFRRLVCNRPLLVFIFQGADAGIVVRQRHANALLLRPPDCCKDADPYSEE